MYVKYTEKELKDIRQYWFSKYCNEICSSEKKVFYELYEAYDDLIKELGYEKKEENDGKQG